MMVLRFLEQRGRGSGAFLRGLAVFHTISERQVIRSCKYLCVIPITVASEMSSLIGRLFRLRTPFLIAVLVCFLPQQVQAQDVREHPGTSSPLPHRPSIALVLGGGGARGAAHIGVLRVLEREHIPIDLIVGNSIGSIIGGLYCAGLPLEKSEELLMDKVISQIYLPKLIWARILFVPLRPVYYAFRRKPVAGLASQQKIYRFLLKQLPADKRLIENLHPRFEAVAVDIADGQVHSFRSGDLARAMAASSAIPGLFKPVEIDSHLYIDGGIGANVPTDTADQRGADVVIAVVVDEHVKELPKEAFTSYRNLGSRLMNLALKSMDRRLKQNADIIVSPKLLDASIFDDDREVITKAILAGEEAAIQALPAIKARCGM